MMRKALIAWDKLCQSKSTGGLNFMNIELWNKAAICKLLWSVCRRKEKLWIIWVHTYYIKGEVYGWKIQRMHRGWFRRCSKLENILRQLDTIWHTFNRWTISYQRGVSKAPRPIPKKLVLNNQGAPKWKWIFRLAVCDRLATRDRIAQWGINTTPLCALYNTCNETLEHLLFECEVSGSIWKKVLRWQTIHRGNMAWQREIQWAIRNCKGRSCGAAVYKIVMAATVYYVWQERN